MCCVASPPPMRLNATTNWSKWAREQQNGCAHSLFICISERRMKKLNPKQNANFSHFFIRSLSLSLSLMLSRQQHLVAPFQCYVCTWQIAWLFIPIRCCSMHCFNDTVSFCSVLLRILDIMYECTILHTLFKCFIWPKFCGRINSRKKNLLLGLFMNKKILGARGIERQRLRVDERGWDWDHESISNAEVEIRTLYNINECSI